MNFFWEMCWCLCSVLSKWTLVFVDASIYASIPKFRYSSVYSLNDRSRNCISFHCVRCPFHYCILKLFVVDCYVFIVFWIYASSYLSFSALNPVWLAYVTVTTTVPCKKILYWTNVCFSAHETAQPCGRATSEEFEALKGLCDIYIRYEVWNVVSAREWDFAAQMIWWCCAAAHLRESVGHNWRSFIDFKNFMTSKTSWLQKHYVVLTVVFSLLRLKVFVNNEERGKCHWSILVPIFLVPVLLMYLTYNNQSTCLSCIQTFHFDFFYVSGKKNYLPPSYLVYGFGFLFKVGSAEFNVSTGDWIICEICIKQKLLYIMRLCFCGSLVTAFLNLFFMYQFTIASLQYNVMSD